jgi:hypothetical protein
MLKKILKIILAIVMVFAVLSVLVAIRIRVNSRDIAPPDFSDLTPPVEEPILPDENAHTFFVKAVNARVMHEDLDKTNASPERVEQILAENEGVFQHLEQGAQCRRCVHPAVTLDSTLCPCFWGFADAGRLLSYKIKHEQAKGDLDAATRDATTLLRYGQLTRQTPTSLITFLFGMSCECTGLDDIRILARDPRLSEQQLRLLLDCVNNAPPSDASMLTAVKSEFQITKMTLDDAKGDIQKLLPRPLFPKWLVFRNAYLPNQTLLELAAWFRSNILNIAKPYSALTRDDDYEFKQPTFSDLFLEKNFLGKILFGCTLISYVNVFIARCKWEANTAATRIILACQLFQRETGRRPQTLDELVPAHLPSVPLDPFDGQPFRYKPDDGIVYSVGESLKDLGGVVASDDGLPQKDKNIVFKIWEE